MGFIDDFLMILKEKEFAEEFIELGGVKLLFDKIDLVKGNTLAYTITAIGILFKTPFLGLTG